MPRFPLSLAEGRLTRLWGVAPGEELERLIATLRLVDHEWLALSEEAGARVDVGLVRGLTLQEVPPHSCFTAQSRLGDLSVHLDLTCPRYFVTAVDMLWHIQLEAYLSCGHEEHDIDPVVQMPGRSAMTPTAAAEEALGLVKDLRVALPSWNLSAKHWHELLKGDDL